MATTFRTVLLLVAVSAGLPVSAARAQGLPSLTTAPAPGGPGPADQESSPASEADLPRAPGGPPPGEPGFGGPGGPMGGPPGYDLTWYPSRPVTGQSTDLGLVRQGLRFGAPAWQDGGDRLMANLSVRNTLFSTDAVLPDTGRAFPGQLWSVNLGVNYMHQFDNGWTGGLMAGVGSASDKPFHSIDEMTANIGAFLRVPAANGRDSWQFMLMYAEGGAMNFPIPMASYNWNPSDQLQVNIGLPLSVVWKPTEYLDVNLSYVPLYNINARVTYRPWAGVRLYGGYEFLNESYFLADRADVNDRFFVLEQRLVTGVRWDFWKISSVEVNGGYSFGRRFGEGTSQWGSLHDQVDVRPGPFLGLRAGWRF